MSTVEAAVEEEVGGAAAVHHNPGIGGHMRRVGRVIQQGLLRASVERTISGEWLVVRHLECGTGVVAEHKW